MPSHIPRNIPLPSTKTWNTYSPGRCGSYLPQVHPTGIGTALRRKRSAICALLCNGPPQQADREGAVIQQRGRRKKEVKSRWRSSPYTTESAVTDRRRKLEEVDVDNENEESMDEENSVRYLRMN
jgi:hypothetical protein